MKWKCDGNILDARQKLHVKCCLVCLARWLTFFFFYTRNSFSKSSYLSHRKPPFHLIAHVVTVKWKFMRLPEQSTKKCNMNVTISQLKRCKRMMVWSGHAKCNNNNTHRTSSYTWCNSRTTRVYTRRILIFILFIFCIFVCWRWTSSQLLENSPWCCMISYLEDLIF